MKKLMTALFILALATGLGAEETFEREVPAQEGGLIEFDLDAGGSITMTGWNNDSVWVLATVSGHDDDIIQVTVDERDGRVLVKSKFTERRTSSNFEGSVLDQQESMEIAHTARVDAQRSDRRSNVCELSIPGLVQVNLGGEAVYSIGSRLETGMAASGWDHSCSI